MDYHSDRFEDFSQLIFKNNTLVAVLPANKIRNVVYSHQGLSYGGLVLQKDCRSNDYVQILKVVLKALNGFNVEELVVKTLPFIYNTELAEEFNYAIHFLKHTIAKVDSYYVIDGNVGYKPNRNRKRALNVANNNGLKVTEEGLSFFWKNILTANLENRFGVKPVHSLNEIQMLQSKFPNSIKSFFASKENIIYAGVVVFISSNVVHFQYSSGNEERTETGALDFLFDYIIKKYSSYKYISFGSSATDSTLKIDKGLSYWKESFGAKLISQTTYKIETNSFNNLDTIFK